MKQIALLLFIGLANLAVGQDYRAAAIQQYAEGNYDVAQRCIIPVKLLIC